MTARELAIVILYKVENAESYANIEIEKELQKSNEEQVEKSLASELVYGVITWKRTIDEIIKMHSSIRLKKISPWIMNILRIGIYQIVFLDKIPPSAAVNESVKLAKKYGHEASSRFTNAILRKIEKNELEKLMDEIARKPILEDEIIAIATSHPLWLVDELLKEHDKKFVTQLLESNNNKPTITLRTNTLRTTREELLQLLHLKGIICEEGKLPDSIYVKKMNDFSNGLFVVQDEAAQMACLQLEPYPGETVLDACSSPGGKTTYLAQLMENRGRIDAWDIHPHRVALVEEVAHKLGVTIIHAECQDATQEKPELIERYDKILLDVPCSGLGVIRKKPDIKWKRTEEDIEELVVIQEKILHQCASYLKKGGRMIYSTCTVLRKENQEQIEKFLKTHPDFVLLKETQLYPHIDGTDGFYIALLERRK